MENSITILSVTDECVVYAVCTYIEGRVIRFQLVVQLYNTLFQFTQTPDQMGIYLQLSIKGEHVLYALLNESSARLCLSCLFCQQNYQQGYALVYRCLMEADFLNPTNNSYIKKLRFEVESIEHLTHSIITETERNKNGNSINQNNRSSRAQTCFDSTCKSAREELYRKMSTFLQSLVQYVDTLSDPTTKVCRPSVVHVPDRYTLPAVCHLLWKRIQKLCEARNCSTGSHMVVKQSSFRDEGGDLRQSSKGVQTDNSCLRYCESCHMSTTMVKSIVHTIDAEQRKYGVPQTHVSAFRKKLASEFLETSQWAAMAGWTTAVRADLEWAAEWTAESQRRCRDLQEARDRLGKDYERVVTALQRDLTLLETRLQAEQAQSRYLKTQIENLNDSLDRRVKNVISLEENRDEYKQKLKSLYGSLHSLNIDCIQLKKKHTCLRRFMKATLSLESRNMLETMASVSMSLKSVESHFTETARKYTDKQKEMQQRIVDKEDLINHLKIIHSTLDHEKRNLLEEIKSLESTIDEKENEVQNTKLLCKEKVNELEKELLEIKAREQLQSCHSTGTSIILFSSSTVNDNTKTVTGDPLSDMENQRKTNKLKIKDLLKENANLKTTIYKLKTLRSNPTRKLSSGVISDG